METVLEMPVIQTQTRVHGVYVEPAYREKRVQGLRHKKYEYAILRFFFLNLIF